MQAANPIIVVPYREGWVQEFKEIASDLRAALGDAALRIDHIGSTSVPGLAAKDIIDVQVTVRDFTEELERAFSVAGYPMSRHRSDHVPPTYTGPESGWEKRLYNNPSGTRRANIHVRRAGSPNGRYALLFRDYLRTHPLAAQAYAQAKGALSRHGPEDWDLYYDVKDPICDIIMAGAEGWAAHSGWTLKYYS